MTSYWIAKIAYNITWIPWHLVSKFFLHYQIIYQNRNVRNLKGPLIIAANHSSWLDPFLLSGIFPIFSPIFPIRFATYQKFFWYFHTALFVRIYGCFSVKGRVGLERTLLPAVSFLRNGQTVGIFPEGRRRHLGRPRKGRRGAAYLAIATSSPILPCKIEGARGFSLKTFFSRKRKVTVYIGQPFLLPPNLNDADNVNHLNDATEIIMYKIGELV